MYSIIHRFIEKNDRIRVVILNGSRANKDIQKDMFQDYDIACFVTDVEPFKTADSIVPFFGKMTVVEQPNIGPWPPFDADGSYHNYNMQCVDGNRIDLSFYSIEMLGEKIKDSLSIILADKDNRCTQLPPPSEESYYISRPTKEEFRGCCDAFLFAIASHIPKTIWRKQLPLLKFYIEGWLREPVLLMLSWEIGIKTGFNKSIGPKGKHLQKYIEKEKWEQYLKTYVDSDYERIWDSVFIFHDFFMQSAAFVAEKCDFNLPREKFSNVLSFLNHVRNLSENAKSIY